MSSHCHKEVFSTSLLAICGWSRLIWLHCAVVLFRQLGWIPPKLSWSIFNVLPFFTNVLKSMAFWNLLWQNDVAVQINVCPVWRKLFCVAAWFQDGGKQRLPSYLSPTNCSLFSIYVYKLCTNHFPSITILQLFLMISSSSKYQLIFFFRESFKQPFGGSILTKLQGVDLNVCRHSLPGIACGYHRLLC